MAARINARYEKLLFDPKSTQRTDYQAYPVTESTPTVYREKVRQRPPYSGLKNQHTFESYDGVLPFNFLHKPKDVVRTNPHHVQEKFVDAVDEEHAEVRKSRPRLYITPGVAMDDAQEDKLILEDFYSTSTARATRVSAAAASKEKQTRAPLGTRPAHAKPIRLPLYEPPVVPEEWRKETLTWEARQLRSLVDPTCTFWLTRKPKSTADTDETSNAVSEPVSKTNP